jgi:hypothetical protein
MFCQPGLSTEKVAIKGRRLRLLPPGLSGVRHVKVLMLEARQASGLSGFRRQAC